MSDNITFTRSRWQVIVKEWKKRHLCICFSYLPFRILTENSADCYILRQTLSTCKFCSCPQINLTHECTGHPAVLSTNIKYLELRILDWLQFRLCYFEDKNREIMYYICQNLLRNSKNPI